VLGLRLCRSVLNKKLKSELVRRRKRFSHIALCYRIVWVREQGDRRLAAAFAALLEQRAGALFVAADSYYTT
jgi:hypothetical protein